MYIICKYLQTQFLLFLTYFWKHTVHSLLTYKDDEAEDKEGDPEYGDDGHVLKCLQQATFCPGKGDGCLTSIGELIITILYIIKCMHVDLFLRPDSYVKICQQKYIFPIQTNFNNSPFMAKTHSLSLMLKDYYDGDRKISGKVDRRDRYFKSF